MLRAAIISLTLTAAASLAPAVVANAAVPVLNPTQSIHDPGREFTDDREYGYGCSVAVDGNNAAVFASALRMAFIYRRDNSGTWVERQQLAFDVESSSICSAVALQGNELLISRDGVVRVYVDNGTEWALSTTIQANDGAEIAAAMIDGNTVAASGEGAAYVFIRSGSSWNQQARLFPSDGAVGGARALQGNTLLFGSDGAVYVFVRSSGAWSEQQKLVATGRVFYPGSTDNFGSAAAVYGDYAVIGAPDDSQITDFEGIPAGAAYVFVRDGNTWHQQQKLTTSDDPDSYGFFGARVAIQKSLIVISAPDRGAPWNIKWGSLYGFVRNGSVWSEQFIAPNGGGLGFGQSLSLSGGDLVAGGTGFPENFYSGGVSFFELHTPPTASNVVIQPGTQWNRIVINANVSDESTGGSNIRGAYYTLDGGAPQGMRPVDGAYDEPLEQVAADVRGLSIGYHTFCVVGIDGLRNASEKACVRHRVRMP